MARSLEARISQVIGEPDIKTVNPTMTPVNETSDIIPQTDKAEETAPDIVSSQIVANADTLSDVPPEPVVEGQQYASAKGIFNAVKKGAAKIEQAIGADEALRRSNLIPESKKILKVEGGFLVQQADDAEVQSILSTIPNYNGKSLNILKFGDTIGTDASEFFARIKEANPQFIEDARRGTIPMDDLLAAANDVGFGDLVQKFAMRKPGDSLPLAEDVAAGIIGMKNLHMEIKTLHEAALKSGDPADHRKLLEAMALAREYTKGISGVVSETGRTLGVVGNLAKEKSLDLTQLSQETDMVFRRFQATDDIKVFDQYWGMLQTDEQKTAFLRGSWWDKLKSGAGKTYDIVQEGYINALLSSPVTHVVNIFGNAAFGTWTTAERYTAAGIGYIKSFAGMTNTERLTFSEANAYAYGGISAFQDALRIAGASFVRGEPMTGSLEGKIELSRKKALTAENLGLSTDSTVGLGIELLGTIQRMPGRFLIAEDEFFKTYNYRAQLRALSQREADQAYFAAIDSGKTKDDAKVIAEKTFSDFMSNPPEKLMDEAMDYAKNLTFQSDLPGKLKIAEKFASLPILKFFVPFFRTPANITIETFKRTPLNPSLYKDMFEGGAKGDLAMARFGLGSAAMATFGSIAYGLDRPDLFITGKPDNDRAKNERDARLGIQPYSIVFKNEDGSYKSVSYSRVEPLSSLLAISADYAKFAKETDFDNMDNWQFVEEVAMTGGLAMAEYMKQQSFVEGMAEIASVFEEFKRTDDRTVIEKFIEKASQGVSGAVITSAPGFGSLTANFERVMDPRASETYIPSSVSKSNPVQDGFYRALDKAMSRVPGVSGMVAPDLNIWGETRMQGTGSSLDLINPIKIMQGKYNDVDMELRRLDIGLDLPNRSIARGVPLNSEQYNRLISMANVMDSNMNLPGDKNYDENSTMLNFLKDQIKTKDYKSMSASDQSKFIKSIYQGYYDNAKKMFMVEESAINEDFRNTLKASQPRKAGALGIGME